MDFNTLSMLAFVMLVAILLASSAGITMAKATQACTDTMAALSKGIGIAGSDPLRSNSPTARVIRAIRDFFMARNNMLGGLAASPAAQTPHTMFTQTRREMASIEEMPIVPRMRTSFEDIGHEAVTEIATDCNLAPQHIRDSGVILRAGGDGEVAASTIYSDGANHRICFVFEGPDMALFPNAVHKTRVEFERAREEEIARRDAAAAALGVTIVAVPYTVDQCERDPTDPSGWRHLQLTDEQRKTRIKTFLHKELISYSLRFAV